MPKNILLIPLDERPVNTRYPQMVGDIAGIDVILPPDSLRGFLREPADFDELSKWLVNEVEHGHFAAALISCDMLGYGNLINSRISNDSAATVIARLGALEQLGSKTPVHAFSLITRVSNANDNVEEPLYWSDWGEKFYAFARLSHMVESGANLSEFDSLMLAGLTADIPDAEKADWLIRRLRNHTVNLSLMDMVARATIDSLLLTSDDTALFGFPSRERDWLTKWRQMIGTTASNRIAMHPGADEVGSALVAKTINKINGKTPKVWPLYAIPTDTEIVALYEDRPIEQTVLGQIDACGCEIAKSPDEADFILGIVTPSPRRIDYRKEVADRDLDARAPFYSSFLDQLARFQSQGKPVALADVAFPNGSDPQMSEMLLSPNCLLKLSHLAAYGAWNTAGNTLGTVVAQASSSLYSDNSSSRIAAEERFLTHRFLEDYGYQQIIRREAREFAQNRWGRREPDPSSKTEQRQICDFIEESLCKIHTNIQSRGVGVQTRIVPGSVRLPWRRTFEVDFDVETLAL